MRKKFWLIGSCVAAIVLVYVSCSKAGIKSGNEVAAVFDASAAKEWYYAVFKKSPEWNSSVQKGKKLPDWKHPVTGKLNNYEAVEFPLVESLAKVTVAGDQSANEADKRRIAEGTLSRILFINKGNNNIEVREIDYVPEKSYLESNKYDISKVSVLKTDNNFTGTVAITKWNETLLSHGYFQNGKLEKVGKRKEATASRTSQEECQWIQYCIWQKDCEIIFNGDEITEICSEWYNTGECWMEEMCVETDPCILYGTGCEEDEGGGDNSGTCNMDCSEVAAILDGVTRTQETEPASGGGAETLPDANGITRKPVNIHRSTITYNWILGYSSTYTLFFNGVLYKNAPNAQWKWETISFDQIAKTAGASPFCMSATVTASVSGPVKSSDKLTASFSSTVMCNVSWNCITSTEVKTYTDYINDTYAANDAW